MFTVSPLHKLNLNVGHAWLQLRFVLKVQKLIVTKHTDPIVTIQDSNKHSKDFPHPFLRGCEYVPLIFDLHSYHNKQPLTTIHCDRGQWHSTGLHHDMVQELY